MEKIFLLGSERSGTNLLRTLLNNHSNITAPIAPHLCDTFKTKYRDYMQLYSNEVLFSDIIEYLNHPFNDWGVDWDPKEMVDKYDTSNFINILNAIFTQKSIDENTDAYFCKDNHNHKYALGIAKEYPEVKFIYLCRDPRDHVASWMRNPVHLHTPYVTIKKWNKEQLACLNINSFFGVNIFRLRYEDLIRNPKKAMTEVLDYLDLPVESNCFHTNKQNKEAEKHPLWKNINKPIKKDNYRKFEDVLSPKEVVLIETIAKNVMQVLNYSLVSDAKYNFGNKYIFQAKDTFREIISKRRNRDFNDNKMKILRDKRKLVNSLFEKFDA